MRRILFRVFLLLTGAGLLGATVAASYFFFSSLRFDLKDVGHIPERSWLYDMDGKVYARLYGENRTLTELSKVSPFFKKALLAREDARFYQHHGIDMIGTLRALMDDLVHHGVRQGGSTITQQLARNSFALGGRDLRRKILEAFVAGRIEASFTKDQILENYINRIYFGSGYYGLETASQAYFGKPADKLTLPEAALLAGLIRSPNRYSPFNNPEGAILQRNEVLNRMAELKMITSVEADSARRTALHVVNRRSAAPQQNYSIDALYRELQGLVSQDQIDGGGLRIYTTLDPILQPAAENAVNNWLTEIEKKPGYQHPKKSDYSDTDRAKEEPTSYLQGAALAVDNRTGAVRALVGGRDYRDSKFNRVLQANRQIGSTFKPFVYAAAFDRGLMPGTLVSDGPIRRGEIAGAPNWHPVNSDGQNWGTVAARDGLIFSRNTMSIRVGELATLERVRQLGVTAGLSRDLPNFPATYLGAFESTVKNVTAAYSAFPSHGLRREPYLIERIDDASGNILYQAHPQQTQVLSPAIAWMTAETMRGVIERGTASSAKSLGLDRYAAGKTGTTDDYKDAWFVGFTNALTCGVWVGFDQPETIQERGYGAALALPIWVRIMEKASRQRYPDGEFPPPEPLVKVQLCAVSNDLATEACQEAGASYELSLPQSRVPEKICPVHQGQPQPFQTDQPPQPQDDNFAHRFFRSFRHLFGG
jgi:penicillin-binding protein 1A